jgi:ribonuclease HI
MVRSKKYYVVHVGRQQGIYTTWADCKAQVDGFKGAIYKGF